MPRVVIAAGGTAGHVVPALAIAAALRDRGAHVEFIGGERAEAELVPAAGFPFHTVPGAAVDRANPVRAARALGSALAGTAKARRILRAIGADVVIGGGGYVAGPTDLAAVSLRVPLAICEADSHLGAANRMLAPLARRAFLAFPVPGRDGPKYVVTGRPVPPETGTVDPAAARNRFGIPREGACLLVFGGSLGARSINEASLAAFGAAAPCTVLHVCGRRDFASIRSRLDGLGAPPHYVLHEYVEPFAWALAAADLAVARAGGSVFELAAAGLPSILVPYPHAAGDHQAKNARWMADAGAAVVVPDADLDGPRLAREVGALLRSPDRRRAMGEANRTLTQADAADRIAAEVLRLADV